MPNYKTENNEKFFKLKLMGDDSDSQNIKLMEDLGNLLSKQNDTINIDFISNFMKYIYIDINKRLQVNIDSDNKPSWFTIGEIKYIFEDKIVINDQVVILFLINKTNSDDKKVLKIYINVPVDLLDQRKLTNQYADQYYYWDMDFFNMFNFNCQTKFIQDQNNNNIILACRNNNAINDYIINVILQKIKQDNSSLNFVKYDNLFITTVIFNKKNIFGTETQESNREYYCVLMDRTDGDLENYYDNLNDQEKEQETRYNNLSIILNKIEQNLNILKDPKYLFTHTDMKLQNVFYKKNLMVT